MAGGSRCIGQMMIPLPEAMLRRSLAWQSRHETSEEVRAEFGEARDHGLRARHALKLQRKRRKEASLEATSEPVSRKADALPLADRPLGTHLSAGSAMATPTFNRSEGERRPASGAARPVGPLPDTTPASAAVPISDATPASDAPPAEGVMSPPDASDGPVRRSCRSTEPFRGQPMTPRRSLSRNSASAWSYRRRAAPGIGAHFRSHPPDLDWRHPVAAPCRHRNREPINSLSPGPGPSPASTHGQRPRSGACRMVVMGIPPENASPPPACGRADPLQLRCSSPLPGPGTSPLPTAPFPKLTYRPRGRPSFFSAGHLRRHPLSGRGLAFQGGNPSTSSAHRLLLAV